MQITLTVLLIVDCADKMQYKNNFHLWLTYITSIDRYLSLSESFTFKEIVSRDFGGLHLTLMDREWVPVVPLDFLLSSNFVFIKMFKFKVLSGLNFYLCTLKMLSVWPGIIFLPRQV